MSAQVIYGFDPLCGWCFGFAPALRALRAEFPDLPVRLAMPGLVTGARVGAYAEMEGYIRGASARLRAVTGRAPSDAFFDMIRRPGVIGESAPAISAIVQAGGGEPAAELAYASAMIEAHFDGGRDLNAAETHRDLAGALGLAAPPDPDWREPGLARMAADRALGIASFPTLIVHAEGRARVLPSLYAPEAVVAEVARARADLRTGD